MTSTNSKSPARCDEHQLKKSGKCVDLLPLVRPAPGGTVGQPVRPLKVGLAPRNNGPKGLNRRGVTNTRQDQEQIEKRLLLQVVCPGSGQMFANRAKPSQGSCQGKSVSFDFSFSSDDLGRVNRFLIFSFSIGGVPRQR